VKATAGGPVNQTTGDPVNEGLLGFLWVLCGVDMGCDLRIHLDEEPRRGVHVLAAA
jgi:hypothetical protein